MTITWTTSKQHISMSDAQGPTTMGAIQTWKRTRSAIKTLGGHNSIKTGAAQNAVRKEKNGINAPPFHVRGQWMESM